MPAKPNIVIGSRNSFKAEKLKWIVSDYFEPISADSFFEPTETADTFEAIAKEKACAYSKASEGFAVATDGGAVIPALGNAWDPVHTKRFAHSDKERIATLLSMMEGKKNRTIEWHESLAVAKNGVLLFSTTQRAMDGVIDTSFNPKHYTPGIWLCSISSFPELGGKNFFELNEDERALTEDSWDKLKQAFVLQAKTLVNS